jgi:hypothetical protein
VTVIVPSHTLGCVNSIAMMAGCGKSRLIASKIVIMSHLRLSQAVQLDILSLGSRRSNPMLIIIFY